MRLTNFKQLFFKPKVKTVINYSRQKDVFFSERINNNLFPTRDTD